MTRRKMLFGVWIVITISLFLMTSLAGGTVKPAKPDAVNKKAILQKAVRPKIPFDANHDPLKESQAAGTYSAFIADGDGWREVGKLTFGKFLRERTIDLPASGRNGEPVRIRLVQTGGGAAHIDAISVGGNPPLQVSGVSDPHAINKLQRRDFDLLDAFRKTLDLSFPPNASERSLKLTARVEPEQISKTPFQFPSANLFKKIDETARFYSYILNSSKPDQIPAENWMDAPEKFFFKEYCRTGSGHPSGFTYGWVSNDDRNLYAKIDFTPDNTMDGNKDYAKLYIKTPTGVKTFKVSEADKTWGSPNFDYTSTAKYQHKVYDFKIPLSELDLSKQEGSLDVQLAFSAYGTASPAQRASKIAAGRYHTVELRSDGIGDVHHFIIFWV